MKQTPSGECSLMYLVKISNTTSSGIMHTFTSKSCEEQQDIWHHQISYMSLAGVIINSVFKTSCFQKGLAASHPSLTGTLWLRLIQKGGRDNLTKTWLKPAQLATITSFSRSFHFFIPQTEAWHASLLMIQSMSR